MRLDHQESLLGARSSSHAPKRHLHENAAHRPRSLLRGWRCRGRIHSGASTERATPVGVAASGRFTRSFWTTPSPNQNEPSRSSTGRHTPDMAAAPPPCRGHQPPCRWQTSTNQILSLRSSGHPRQRSHRRGPRRFGRTWRKPQEQEGRATTPVLQAARVRAGRHNIEEAVDDRAGGSRCQPRSHTEAEHMSGYLIPPHATEGTRPLRGRPSTARA